MPDTSTTGPRMIVSLVSTIIPVFNRPDLVRRAIDSVLAQNHRPIEVIVVDDGSTDDTPAVLDRLAAESPDIIRVLHKANGGPGLAREAGRQAACGEFIQYLDSDDLLLPRKLELQGGALREHPECAVAYCQTRFVDECTGRVECPWKRTGEAIDTMFPSFAADRWWGTSTPLYRRSVTDAVGPWTCLWNCEDWEYDCRIAAMGTRLAYVPQVASEEHGHSGSRLSHSGSASHARLSHRARAHELIAGHIRSAGMPDDLPEVRHFGNLSFLLARQCGAAGQAAESAALMTLVRRLCPRTVAHSRKFRFYAILGGSLGWCLAGRLAAWRDRRGWPQKGVGSHHPTGLSS